MRSLTVPHRRGRLRRPLRDRAIHLRGAGATGKRAHCSRRQDHMNIMPDADMDQAANVVGAGYGSAGERCMAVSVAVPVARRRPMSMEKLIPRVESSKRCASTIHRPISGRSSPRRRSTASRYVDFGIKEGAKFSVDGRGSNLRPTRRLLHGGCLFDNVTKDMRIDKEEISGRCCQRRRRGFRSSARSALQHDYGNVSPSSPVTAMRA